MARHRLRELFGKEVARPTSSPQSIRHVSAAAVRVGCRTGPPAPTRSSRRAASGSSDVARALSRTSTPVIRGRKAMDTAPRFSGSPASMRSAREDSAMPVVWKTRWTSGSRRPPSRSRNSGSTPSSNSPRISEGTPGRSTTIRSSTSSTSPGAVPTGLGRASAPSGIRAMRSLPAGSGVPRQVAHRVRSSSSSALSRRRGLPSASATTSRVMSSPVGPRPPETSTTSASSRARASAPRMSGALSPTTNLARIGSPSSAARRPIHAPLVSTVKPARSSSPTATMAQLAGGDALRLSGDSPPGRGCARNRGPSNRSSAPAPAGGSRR